MNPWSRKALLVAGALWVSVAASACAHQTAMATPSEAPEAKLDCDQLLAIAAAAEKLGDRLRAQQYLVAARRAGAAEARVLPRLLRLYVQDGQYRLAIDTVQDQLRSHPQQYELRMVLAKLYEATDLEAAAVAQYERVLVTAPTEARAHFALAKLLHRDGRDSGRADEHFRTYLELQPRGPNAAEARDSLMKELP